jgi:ribosomal-protein-alanine N-acetyltransferase
MTKRQNIPIKIRTYQNDDFLSVTALEEAGIHGTYRSAVFVRQMSACCTDTFLVAVDGSQPVGYSIGIIVQNNPVQAWILRLAVSEAYRRNGVGTALVSAMIDRFGKKGVHEIFLTVSPENQPARHLYQQQGFVQEQEYPAYFGSGQDRLILKKQMNLSR